MEAATSRGSRLVATPRAVAAHTEGEPLARARAGGRGGSSRVRASTLAHQRLNAYSRSDYLALRLVEAPTTPVNATVPDPRRTNRTSPSFSRQERQALKDSGRR